jgi:uncharacterized membrane protein YidH (DUF202 family)
MMTPSRDTGDAEDADPGLARERTHLAWTRTAISVGALGGAILKVRPAEGIPILALSLLVWWLGRLPRASDTGRSQAWRLLVITVTVTGISLAALLTSFLGPGSGGLVIGHH